MATLGSETKQGEVYGASVVGGGIGHKVHKGWAEGPDLAPIGSKAFKWGTSRIRVGVGRETSGTCCGREVGDKEGLLQYQARGMPPPWR